MAFINKETFEIFTSCMIGDNDIKDVDLYFEVDDMIAPAISIFNKKGYYTDFCCQGHPFLYLDDDIVSDIPEREINNVYPDTETYVSLGKTTHYIFRKTKNFRRSYIKFRPYVTLPYLPKGWSSYTLGSIYDTYSIERVYDTAINDSAFFVELAKDLNELYLFALSLPDISYNDDPKIKEVIDNIFTTIPDLTEVEKGMIISTYKEGNQSIDEILHDILNYTGEEIESDDV